MNKKFTILFNLKALAFTVFAFVGALATQSQVLSDETPGNWKFDNHALGNAKDLFIVEGAREGGNLSYPFRLADGKEGAFVVVRWTGSEIAYGDMTEAQKQNFEDFYASCNIIDGASKGHIFCYQGINSAMTYNGAVKNVSSFSGATLNILSKDNHPYGDYRVTLTLRFLANEGESAGNCNMYIGTSHWDGVDGAASIGSGGYRNFNIPYAPAYNDYWVTYEFDIRTVENSSSTYKYYPFNLKFGLGGMSENGIILIDDIKLEKIQAIDNAYIPMKQTANVATGVSYEKGNELIVFGSNGLINVVDATESIEVYTINGKLLATKVPNNSLTTFNVNKRGIYLVKVGNETRKVVL